RTVVSATSTASNTSSEAGTLAAVGSSPRSEQSQIRLRFRPRQDDDRVLRGDHGPGPEAREKQSVGVDHAADVSGVDGRHLVDLALDQLDTLVLAENAGLRHPMILVHREEPACELDLDSHRPPPEPV